MLVVTLLAVTYYLIVCSNIPSQTFFAGHYFQEEVIPQILVFTIFLGKCYLAAQMMVQLQDTPEATYLWPAYSSYSTNVRRSDDLRSFIVWKPFWLGMELDDKLFRLANFHTLVVASPWRRNKKWSGLCCEIRYSVKGDTFKYTVITMAANCQHQPQFKIMQTSFIGIYIPYSNGDDAISTSNADFPN